MTTRPLPTLLLALLLWLPLAVWAAQKPPGAAIASANRHATEAGLAVLAQGGNAFDAAVAVSAALSVVEPESSGIGGGGFFLLYDAAKDRAVFVDARERAPLAAHRDMYLDAEGNPIPKASIDGALAVATPGLPAGLVHVAERYGKLPLKDALAPAIRLAERGFPWGEKNRLMMGWREQTLSPAAAKVFLRGGKNPAVGTRIVNRDLARVLKALAEQGHDGFYRGAVAERLAKGIEAAGGIIRLDDFHQYQVLERAPIEFEYRGQRVITAPPPSSGGVALASMLHMLAGFPHATMGPVDRAHLLTEVMRRAYRDRAIYLGDPDFVDVPTSMLLSPYYAAGLRASIRLDRATPSDSLPGISVAEPGDNTTHFSIIDADGNLAAVTQTVNLPFGSGLMVEGTGFMLNNEMDDFSIKPMTPNAFGLVGQDANAIAPLKRPLSSMTPTLLIGAERTAVLGTPGGSRIISMVLLGMLGVLDGADAKSIVSAPRIHHQYLPDQLMLEPGALDDAAAAALEARGHTLQRATRPWGNMQMVIWNRKTGTLDAGSDPRWTDGGAATDSGEGAIYR